MNLDELQRKLIAVARANPSSDRVPYAFGKRIIARLRAQPAVDEWALWARALWRAAASCIVITLLLSTWSFFTSPSKAAANDLSQEIDNTVLAAVDQEPPTELVR